MVNSFSTPRRVERWRAHRRVRWLLQGFRPGPQSGSHGHVSSTLPGIPYGGFSPVRLQAPGTCEFSRELSRRVRWLKPDPGIHHFPRQFSPAFGTASG